MATYIVGGVLLLIVAAVCAKLIRDRRAGKTSCSRGCTGDCPGCKKAAK